MTYCIYKPTTNEVFEFCTHFDGTDVNKNKILNALYARGEGYMLFEFKEDMEYSECVKKCGIKMIEMLANCNNIKVNIEDC